jgi:4-amino-4-deoxy-L-arabinose transferase-like glycosyltransferase
LPEIFDEGDFMELFSPRRMTLWLIAVGIVGRFVLASVIGLGVDESYVVSIARFFSLSYFDHPPLHFWLVELMSLVTGSELGLVLRAPFILLFAWSTWLLFRITSRCFGEMAGFCAALLMNSSAVFSLSSGSWILPDGPLFFFMLATVDILLTLAVSEKKSLPLPTSIGVGFLIGLGLLSKYHAIFIPLGMGLFLLTTARRHLLLTAGPYLALLVAGLIFSPVLLWNCDNGWASFEFQGARGAFHGFFPERLLANIAGQALWILPWIWLPLLWVFVKNLLLGPASRAADSLQPRRWLFCCLAASPIFLFTLASLWQDGQALLFHWQAPGYLMLFPLLGEAVANGLKKKNRLVRAWLIASVILFLLLGSVVISHTATGWLQSSAPHWFAYGDPSLDALDWRELPTALAARGLLDQPDIFIVSPNWIDAGKIGYAMKGTIPLLCLNAKEPHHFAFISDHTRFKGQNALLIARRDIMDLAVTQYRPYFADIQSRGSIWLYRNGVPALEVSVYSATIYTGTYPLPYGYR